MTDDFARDVTRLAGAAGGAVLVLRLHGETHAADRLQAAIDALGKPKERDDG